MIYVHVTCMNKLAWGRETVRGSHGETGWRNFEENILCHRFDHYYDAAEMGPEENTTIEYYLPFSKSRDWYCNSTYIPKLIVIP